MNPLQPLLDVSALRTEFETHGGVVHAVSGASFSVRSGEIVGLVGETGCGKSVTIRSILGLLPPTGRVVGGEVDFDGGDLLRLPRKQLRKLRGKHIGFIAQNPFSSLNPVLPLHRQFHNIAQAHGRASPRQSHSRALEMLDHVGIAGPERVLTGYGHELSGGQAQRVVIAMALFLQPRLVVADEPTTGLDLTVQRQILDLIRALVREENRAMLLVTHDLGVVAQYCDRVIVMYAGRVMESGTVTDVFQDPRHPYTAALLAAVPKKGRPVAHIRGRLPDLIQYPVGCPFAERCDHVLPECTEVAPEERLLGSDRMISCHLSEGVREHADPRVK